MRFDGKSLAYYNNEKVKAAAAPLSPFNSTIHFPPSLIARWGSKNKIKSRQGWSVITPHVTFRPSCMVKSIDVGT